MYIEKHIKTLAKAISKGGVTSNDLLVIYDSRSSVYTTLKRLTDNDLLNKTKAPSSKSETYIYCPTKKTKELFRIKKEN